MSSPYQEFAQKARERFLEKRKKMAAGTGQYQFTMHAQYKMRQYGLSEQRVKSVIRSPKRREEGIVKDTVAVMQPVSVKRSTDGKEAWKQEIWVMFVVKGARQEAKDNRRKMAESKKRGVEKSSIAYPLLPSAYKVISAWRYPGVSPKRNPIPEDILRELEDGSILGEEEGV